MSENNDNLPELTSHPGVNRAKRIPQEMVKKPRDVQLMADMIISDARDEDIDREKLIVSPVFKRTTEQRERDLTEISRALLHGLTRSEVLEQLNSRRAYSIEETAFLNDIKTIYARWQESYVTDFQTLKTRELAHVDELERAYWEAWARSTRDKEETKSLIISDKSGSTKGTTTPMYERVKTERKKTERDGSPMFLAGVQWCVEQRCKILGLEAPQKYEIDWRSEAKKAGIEPGDIFNALVGEYIKDQDSNPSMGRDHDERSMDGSPEDSED